MEKNENVIEQSKYARLFRYTDDQHSVYINYEHKIRKIQNKNLSYVSRYYFFIDYNEFYLSLDNFCIYNSQNKITKRIDAKNLKVTKVAIPGNSRIIVSYKKLNKIFQLEFIERTKSIKLLRNMFDKDFCVGELVYKKSFPLINLKEK
jgi:hypothetical protein